MAPSQNSTAKSHASASTPRSPGCSTVLPGWRRLCATQRNLSPIRQRSAVSVSRTTKTSLNSTVGPSAIAASFGVRAEHTWVGAKYPPAVALRGWERARSYGYSGQLPASTVLCSTSPVSHSSKHWDIVTESVEGTGRKDHRYTNFRRPDVRLLSGRPGGSERLVGVGAEGEQPGDACALPRWPRAAVAARRGRRERNRRRRAERLQRCRLPAASGSCARLTARAAGVGCVALPGHASRSAPTRPAQVAAPPRSRSSPASQDRSPHGRAFEHQRPRRRPWVRDPARELQPRVSGPPGLPQDRRECAAGEPRAHAPGYFPGEARPDRRGRAS